VAGPRWFFTNFPIKLKFSKNFSTCFLPIQFFYVDFIIQKLFWYCIVF
jgi:hypothetical protein